MKKKINSIPLLVTVCGHSVAFTECQARHGMCNIKSDINQQWDDSLCNKAHVSIMQCTLTENVLTAQISFFVQSTFKTIIMTAEVINMTLQTALHHMKTTTSWCPGHEKKYINTSTTHNPTNCLRGPLEALLSTGILCLH